MPWWDGGVSVWYVGIQICIPMIGGRGGRHVKSSEAKEETVDAAEVHVGLPAGADNDLVVLAATEIGIRWNLVGVVIRSLPGALTPRVIGSDDAEHVDHSTGQ